MTLNDQTIEMAARMAANQLITQYMPQARAWGLDNEQLKKLIKRVSEIAVEILNQHPA